MAFWMVPSLKLICWSCLPAGFSRIILHIEQLVQAWNFATIFKDNLTDVRELPHSLSAWQRLESRFNIASLARCTDLQHMLTNLTKLKSQSMDDYLHSLKTLADSLPATQAAVSDIDLIQYTVNGLGANYDSFVDSFTYLLPW